MSKLEGSAPGVGPLSREDPVVCAGDDEHDRRRSQEVLHCCPCVPPPLRREQTVEGTARTVGDWAVERWAASGRGRATPSRVQSTPLTRRGLGNRAGRRIRNATARSYAKPNVWYPQRVPQIFSGLAE